MNQYNSNDLIISNHDLLLSSVQHTETFQFNTVDTNFMNSNEFFILQPERSDYNINQNTSDNNIPEIEMENINSKKIKPPASIINVKPKIYSCDLCNCIYERSIELKQHKRSEHKILTKTYKCAKCSDSFNFENNYKIHIYSHLKICKQCPVCLQNFKRTTIFLKHLKIHQNNDCYQCDKCKMEFEFKEYYDWHLNDNNKYKNCNISAKMVKNKESKEYNKKIISKKHVCQICGKKFQKPFYLKRHENIHFNIKPFECQVCSSKFNQKNSLERHKLVHTKEKPYECLKCNMRFSQRPNLLLHDKNVHSSSPNDTTKYPCPKCSCIFNKTNSLNRHISEKHKLSLNDEYSVENVMEQLKNFLNQQNSQNTNNNNNDENTIKNEVKSQSIEIKLPKNNPINNNINLENIKNSENIKQSTGRDDNKSSIIKFVRIIDTLNPNKDIKYKMVQQIIQNDRKWFACNVCEKKFKLSYDLLRHLTVHTKERAFICGICSIAFSLKNTLKCHMKVHSREKKFHCTICFSKFRSLNLLNDHISVHGKLKPFLCQLCGKSFNTSYNLKIHQQIHRLKDNRIESIEKTLIPPIKIQDNDNIEEGLLEKFDEKFQCLICGVLLKSMSHLKFHEKQHLNLQTFECTICYKRFITKSSLNVHRKIHFTNRSLECELCSSKFRNSSDLKRHSVVHSNERKFLCPYCSKLFKTKSTCLAHIKLHAKEQITIDDQKCTTNYNEIEENKLENMQEEINIEQDDTQEYSSIQTNNEINLNIQSQEINLNNYSHLTDNDLIVPNLLSGKTNISSESAITINNNNFQEKEKFIDLQDIQKTQNNRLKNNFIVKSIHKESQLNDTNDILINDDTNNSLPFNIKIKLKKNFPCEYCDKIFKKPIDYRRHIRTHTKEKPFICEICNKRFSVKCTLDNHIKIHDINRQTYNCVVCNKKYVSKSVLNTHLRLHTGVMPYECNLCLKKFRTLGHRNAHMCINNKKL